MPRHLNEESKQALADPTIPDLAKDVIRVTDNVTMALAFPTDQAAEVDTTIEDAADFLVVGRQLESQALATYLKLKLSVGKKLADAERDYHEHRQRNLRLFNIVSGAANADGTASS